MTSHSTAQNREPGIRLSRGSVKRSSVKPRMDRSNLSRSARQPAAWAHRGPALPDITHTQTVWTVRNRHRNPAHLDSTHQPAAAGNHDQPTAHRGLV